MLQLSFDELSRLENVSSIGSDLQSSPLNDESLTIFLKNGYRLISTKTLFGQTMTLEPFEDSIKSKPSYQTEVYHDVDVTKDNKPQDKFLEIESGKRKEISMETFNQKIREITGDPVYNFLIQRHQSLPYRTMFNANSSSFRK